MSTTVRIRDEDKERLDRLQAKITLETGEKPSLEEVLHRLVELGETHEVELTEGDTGLGLTEDEKAEVLEATYDLGTPTREQDIDEILYGGPEGPA